MPLIICNSILKNGIQCRYKAQKDSEKCGFHMKEPKEKTKCSYILKSGKPCPYNSKNDSDKCGIHNNLKTKEHKQAKRAIYNHTYINKYPEKHRVRCREDYHKKKPEAKYLAPRNQKKIVVEEEQCE